jgi:hypothetical protein
MCPWAPELREPQGTRGSSLCIVGCVNTSRPARRWVTPALTIALAVVAAVAALIVWPQIHDQRLRGRARAQVAAMGPVRLDRPVLRGEESTCDAYAEIHQRARPGEVPRLDLVPVLPTDGRR